MYDPLTDNKYVINIYMTTRSELKSILRSAGDMRDLPRYLELEDKPRRSAWDNYQLRVMQPAFGAQTFIKRLIGFGAIAAVSYFTVTQGLDAYAHFQTVNSALGDIQATLHNLNVLNVAPSGQKILTDLGVAKENMLTGIVTGAKAALGSNVDLALVALQPWKRVRRRGYIAGII